MEINTATPGVKLLKHAESDWKIQSGLICLMLTYICGMKTIHRCINCPLELHLISMRQVLSRSVSSPALACVSRPDLDFLTHSGVLWRGPGVQGLH